MLDYSKRNSKDRTPKRLRKYSYAKATDKQLKYLDILNVDYPDGLSKESASYMIKKYSEPKSNHSNERDDRKSRLNANE